MAFEEWMAEAVPGGYNWQKQKFQVFFFFFNFFSSLLHCKDQLMYEYNYQLSSDRPKYMNYELEWATMSPVGKSYNKNRLWCLSLDVKYPFLSHVPQNIYAPKSCTFSMSNVFESFWENYQLIASWPLQSPYRSYSKIFCI